MPDWPSALKFCYVEGSLNGQPDDGVLRTSMDTGPAKSRPRSTAVPKGLNFTLAPMTLAEFDQFETWFANDIAGGALIFTADHPRTGVSSSFRFRSPYQESYSGKDVFVQVDLEVLS